MLIAIPFALQSARSAGMGARLLVGIVIGVGFHFLGQLAGHLALLNSWSAPLTTVFLPVVVLVVAIATLHLQDRPRMLSSS
jgi:lipopolysaccharide export system permease protein